MIRIQPYCQSPLARFYTSETRKLTEYEKSVDIEDAVKALEPGDWVKLKHGRNIETMVVLSHDCWNKEFRMFFWGGNGFVLSVMYSDFVRNSDTFEYLGKGKRLPEWAISIFGDFLMMSTFQKQYRKPEIPGNIKAKPW